MSVPFVSPSLSRRTSSISRNLVPASLRNPQTLDAYQRRRGGRTKLRRDRSRTLLVYIYSRSRRGLLRVVTEIALKQYAYRFDTRYIYNNKLIGLIIVFNARG